MIDTESLAAYRVECTYQMFGDMEAKPWAHLVLNHAKEQDLILGYKYLGFEPMRWGIQLVQFSVDVALPWSMPYSEKRNRLLTLLNGPIIHDSDVEIITIEPISKDAHE